MAMVNGYKLDKYGSGQWVLMRSFFNRNWARAYRGSLGWTKTAGGLNWRMSDRLGCGRIAALSTCGF